MASIYPFSVQAPFGQRGPYVGTDVLAGGAPFCWDPFEAYRTGAVTNPNTWVLGEPGNGKSALVKTLLWRMAAVYGTRTYVDEDRSLVPEHPSAHGQGRSEAHGGVTSASGDDPTEWGTAGRWFAVVDPKGEYRGLAERLGLAVVRLTPGGTTQVNPLAGGPSAAHGPRDRLVLRQAEMLATLLATVLGRPLTQLDDAAVLATLEHLAAMPGDIEPTLNDVAALLTQPTDAMVERLRVTRDRLVDELSQVAYALDKLLTRSLRGMFDGPSTIPLRWDGPGLVLDLSAVPLDSDALPLVMVAAASWLQQLLACPGPQRVQVLDEAWALLGNRHTATWLQACFKLGRTYGTANLCVAHRVSDLVAQADDGSATSKIAAGLLADSATKVILRQAPDQVAAAADHVGLTGPEASIISQLTRGRALWKIGSRTTLVHHLLAPSETPFCDTDARMSAAER